jgi:hypothetical protein
VLHVLWGFLGAWEDLQYVTDVYLHRSLVVVLIRGLGLRNVEIQLISGGSIHRPSFSRAFIVTNKIVTQ